jgi:signal transduction histidine kinase/CheY-like chemotaxis protein
VKGERILILAPVGRDGPLAEEALRAAGFEARACSDVEQFCAAIDDAGAAVLTEEALFPAASARLGQKLAQQPPWSDLPLIVFGSREVALAEVGNVTLLDRPVRMRTLITAVRSALRARRRQYQVRDLLLALEQSVRDRDQFLAMLGHELRNPLAALSSATDLIDRQAGERFLRERAVMSRQLRHLSRLVEDLLDVSRVTRGKIAMRLEEVDLLELTSRLVLNAQRVAREQGVELEMEATQDPVRVHGDVLRLEQVVGNLLSNAIKYTDPGGSVGVSIAREGDRAVLRVTDTGVGISADMLPRIFDLFAQAPGALDRAKGGMGIGLTLVRRLTESHGGTVEAFSEGLGRGSKFVVRLPLSHAAPAAQVKAHPAAATSPRPLRVVLAEDNEDARELLQLALEQRGHSVVPCGDGDSAVERALAQRPDAMVIDLGLPGRDGFEVARHVRAKLGREVRLVALTGYGQPADRQKALDAGFDVFLVKPADFETLEGALASA